MIKKGKENGLGKVLETVSLVVVVAFIFVMFLGMSLAILGGLL